MVLHHDMKIAAQCYKPEGRGFHTRWGERFVSICLCLPAVLGPGKIGEGSEERREEGRVRKKEVERQDGRDKGRVGQKMELREKCRREGKMKKGRKELRKKGKKEDRKRKKGERKGGSEGGNAIVRRGGKN
jgi:hypothetical protein